MNFTVILTRTIEGIPWKHKTYFLPRTAANKPNKIVPTKPPTHRTDAIHDISCLVSAPLLSGVNSSDCNSKKLDDGLSIVRSSKLYQIHHSERWQAMIYFQLIQKA